LPARGMIDIVQNKIERAILVAVKTRFHEREVVREHLNELEELTRTAGAVTAYKLVQERPAYDASFYIGKGKAEEIAAIIEEEPIDLIIFDDDLSPVQARNLERLLNRKILDRSGLILDVFAMHAKTKTARTQVELAQLQYLLPRLTRAWTHLSKQFGGIGTKGPGETQIETDRRLVRDRIAFLKEKLKEIQADREVQTKQRKDIAKVTLAGYTNAGKSTLFNLLTNAGALVEDMLFATLDSTTRVYELRKNVPVLLSDTVGFIRKLPHHLVASFRSTLSEIREADIILHVVDCTHDYFEDHISVVTQTLEELGCKGKKQILVLNKIDALGEKVTIEFLKNKYPNAVLISAARGINISSLTDAVAAHIETDYEVVEFTIPYDRSRASALLRGIAEVLEEEFHDDGIRLTVKIKKDLRGKAEAMAGK
jgi:GTP-binding protein HflX